MILTNSNRFRCLKFSYLIYLSLVFIYDFDKLKPFSVSEIQLPYLYSNLWQWLVYLYMTIWNQCQSVYKYEYCK
jgi:hypothetical protein